MILAWAQCPQAKLDEYRCYNDKPQHLRRHRPTSGFAFLLQTKAMLKPGVEGAAAVLKSASS
eukprot:scaffold5970_cov52-Prasinocladus_malaysianus.AAC.1